jgi:hypothetical protein
VHAAVEASTSNTWLARISAVFMSAFETPLGLREYTSTAGHLGPSSTRPIRRRTHPNGLRNDSRIGVDIGISTTKAKSEEEYVMDPPFWQQMILKVLDWPVLLFLAVAILVFIFRRQIGSALDRGDIVISWGQGRSIHVAQLSKSLDEELDPIRDEIDSVKEAVAVLKSAGAPPVLPAEPKTLSHEARRVASDRMVDALRDGRYVWRSIERLATIGGVSEGQALDMLREDNANVVLGRGKSQQPIARLRSRTP